jgi:RNA polymerase sigma factor (sigma-70 family)
MLDKARPSLTELERQIVEKRFIGGMTFAEIAAELKLPQGTVTTAYYRALKKILVGLPNNPPNDMDP